MNDGPTGNEAYYMRLADGCFAGMMDDMEMAVLALPLARGWLERTYEGTSGLLGLATLRITDAGRTALSQQKE